MRLAPWHALARVLGPAPRLTLGFLLCDAVLLAAYALGVPAHDATPSLRHESITVQSTPMTTATRLPSHLVVRDVHNRLHVWYFPPLPATAQQLLLTIYNPNRVAAEASVTYGWMHRGHVRISAQDATDIGLSVTHPYVDEPLNVEASVALEPSLTVIQQHEIQTFHGTRYMSAG